MDDHAHPISPARSGWPWVAHAAWAIALALLATAVCDYRFGVYDQGQYLVQVLALEDGSLFPGDPYLDAFGPLRSVVWPAIAAATTEASRPAVLLALTLAIAAINAALAASIGRALSGGFVGAGVAASLVFVVPKEGDWFGLVSLSDIELTASLVALPFVFASLALFVGGRVWVSLAVAALAVPIQGQTGAALLAAWFFAQFLRPTKTMGLRVALGLIFIMGVALLLAARAEARRAIESPDAYARAATDLFPAMVDPLRAPWIAWSPVIGILFLGLLAWWGIGRAWREEGGARARFGLWWAGAMVYPAAGVVLHAIGSQDPLLWKLMIGRSFMLPQIAALVAIGVWAVAWMVSGNTPRRVIAAVVLTLVVIWPMERLGFWGAMATALAMLIGILGVCRGGLGLGSAEAGRARAWPGLVAATGAAAVVAVASFVARPFPWIRSGEDTAWLDAQRWAREHTPPDARFITPPHRSGWRVGSHRATHGEIKDGCLLFYAGEPLVHWAGRMRSLGLQSPFRFLEAGQQEGVGRMAWSTEQLAAVREAYQEAAPRLARSMAPAYVVVEGDAAPDELGDPVWTGPGFAIHLVPSP